jgi:hypothetical protein
MIKNLQPQKELTGFVYGFLGVLVFSLTLPATRIAVLGFDPVFVGLGRAFDNYGIHPISWGKSNNDNIGFCSRSHCLCRVGKANSN